jgi:hypothetical protein
LFYGLQWKQLRDLWWPQPSQCVQQHREPHQQRPSVSQHHAYCRAEKWTLGFLRMLQVRPTSFFSIEIGSLRHLCPPISDNVDGRALTFGTPPVGGPSNNSVETCTAACLAAGYSLAGMEYSDECCTHYPSAQASTFVRSLCFL